jgi:hypothetical protein
MRKLLVTTAILVSFMGTASTMSVMTNATGPYNYNCSVFADGKPTERAAALAFAQGYFAALNLDLDVDRQINLQQRWRELNEYVVRYCTDKKNEYLYRRFVNDAAYAALEDMRKGGGRR